VSSSWPHQLLRTRT